MDSRPGFIGGWSCAEDQRGKQKREDCMVHTSVPNTKNPFSWPGGHYFWMVCEKNVSKSDILEKGLRVENVGVETEMGINPVPPRFSSLVYFFPGDSHEKVGDARRKIWIYK